MKTPSVQGIALATLLGVGGLLGVTACGDDETDDTLATASTVVEDSTTTTSGSAESTSTSAPTTTAGDSTTTTAPSDGEPTAAGKAVLTTSTGITPLDVTACSSSGESSLTLTAVDADGGELDVRARNDLGAVVYRGADGNREGTTVRVTVGAEAGFNVVGGLEGQEFTLTGRCP